jgi:hypothetical protein
MSKPRFVLDTNLIVSAALLEKSLARQAFEVALLQGTILVSDPFPTSQFTIHNSQFPLPPSLSL